MTADVEVRTAATRPSVAAIFLLAALVAYPLYPKVGLVKVSGTYIPIRFDDIITAVLGLVWAATLLRQRRVPVFPVAIGALAALWMASGLISLIVGVAILHSIGAATGFTFWAKPFEYLLIGLIGFDLVRTRQVSVKWVLAAVFAAAGLVTMYGVLERIGVFPSFPGTTPIPGVIISTIGDPHELASYVGLVVVIGVALWPSLSRNARICLGVGLIPAVFVMFNAGARSEYLTLFGVMVVLAVWPLTRGLRKPALTAAAVLLLVFFSPIAIDALKPPAPSTGTSHGGGSTAPTVTSRLGDPTLASSLHTRFLVKWPDDIKKTLRDPLFGLGPSSGTEAVDGYYVRALLEFGIVGLALFLGLLLSIWRAIRRTVASETGLNRDLAVGLLAGTLFVAGVGILIDTWVASRVMEMYWPLLGVTLGIAAVQTSTVRAAEPAVA